jgi:hypothetical protein
VNSAQDKAIDKIAKTDISMPAWAVATVGILNALVTIVLALGINIGDIVDIGVRSKIDKEKKQIEIRGDLEKTATQALSEVLIKQIDNTSSLKQLEIQKQIESLRKEVELLRKTDYNRKYSR